MHWVLLLLLPTLQKDSVGLLERTGR